MTNPGWTHERVERLKVLWSAGKSASEIARELQGGVTRNGVIGKVHRLGLSGRETPSALQTKVVRGVRAPVVKKAPASGSIYAPASRPPKPTGAAVLFSRPSASDPVEAEKLRAEHRAVGEAAIKATAAQTVASPDASPFLEARHGCKWPIGEGAAMLFCCNPVERGNYCAGHAQIAYTATPQRRNYTNGKAATLLTRHDGVEYRKPKAANDGLWDSERAA